MRMTLPHSTGGRVEDNRKSRLAGPVAPSQPKRGPRLGHAPLVGPQLPLERADEAVATPASRAHREPSGRPVVDAGPSASKPPVAPSGRLAAEKPVASPGARGNSRPGNDSWTTELGRRAFAPTAGHGAGTRHRSRAALDSVLTGAGPEAPAKPVSPREPSPPVRPDSTARIQVRPRPATAKVRPATSRQLQFIRALAREIGMADAALKSHARRHFGAGTVELSQGEAARFIHRLGRMVAEMSAAAAVA